MEEREKSVRANDRSATKVLYVKERRKTNTKKKQCDSLKKSMVLFFDSLLKMTIGGKKIRRLNGFISSIC